MLTIIQMGKPPAVPGRHAQFDKSGKMQNLIGVSRSKFNVNEALHEQRSKFSPHEVGM
jgi:hypothetical protein